jgi:hypothetical protein
MGDIDHELLKEKGYQICQFCEGKGTGVSWWGLTSGEIGKCGTCEGSGFLPLRGYYFISEKPPTRDELGI